MMRDLERLRRSLFRVAEEGKQLAFERRNGGWTLTGPYRPVWFVEPGCETDCNDFAVPGIAAELDEAKALALCLEKHGKDDAALAHWGAL